MTYPIWPLEKIRANLATFLKKNEHEQQQQQQATTPKLYVLLTTGALNPVHRGHIEALRHCVQHVSRLTNNGVVLGAFLCPSGDHYLKLKFGGKPNDFYFPADVRYQACVTTIGDDPMISVAGFEVAMNDRWADFPEVCDTLQKFLDTNKEQIFPQGTAATVLEKFGNIEVIYCCGSDLVENGRLFSGIRYPNGKFCRVACTPRGEGEVKTIEELMKYSRQQQQQQQQQEPSAATMIPRTLLLPPLPSAALAEMSSTKARAALKSLMGVMDPQVIAVVLAGLEKSKK